MTATAFASLLGYMLVCSFTPGPGNILALNTTSTYGWKRSRLLILGICLGYAIVQMGCSIALYSLNQVFEPALKILRYVGGIYMIWLAVHIFRSQPGRKCDGEKSYSFRRTVTSACKCKNIFLHFFPTQCVLHSKLRYNPGACTGWLFCSQYRFDCLSDMGVPRSKTSENLFSVFPTNQCSAWIVSSILCICNRERMRIMAYKRKLDKDIRCPLEYGMELFGGKWNSRIICVLSTLGTLRYSELRREMGNITDAVLAASLKELIANDIINRKSYDEIPPRVEYSLTEKGKSVVPILQSICEWAGLFYKESSDQTMVQCQKCDHRG